MEPNLKTWFAEQGNWQKVLILRDLKPDKDKTCPIYIQLSGIGVALYEDGRFFVEDTTGG